MKEVFAIILDSRVPEYYLSNLFWKRFFDFEMMMQSFGQDSGVWSRMVSLKLIYYEHFNFFFECTQIVIVSKDKYVPSKKNKQTQ